MKPTTLLGTIRLRDFLSFGPSTETFPLGNLNVIIGANGSGKSNLIEALSIIQAAPLDLPKPIHEGGGVTEWYSEYRRNIDRTIRTSREIGDDRT
jgi:predicted ATPase